MLTLVDLLPNFFLYSGVMDSAYLPFLRSKQKLERDKGLEIIKDILKSPSKDDISALEKNILKLVPITEEGSWEEIHGGLLACALMLEAGLGSDELCKEIQGIVPQMLEHQEPRVRLSAGKKILVHFIISQVAMTGYLLGEVMGQMCRYRGAQVYASLQDILVSGISSNMERDSDALSETSDQQPESPMDKDGRVS